MYPKLLVKVTDWDHSRLPKKAMNRSQSHLVFLQAAPDALEDELIKIWTRNFGPKGVDANGHLLHSSIGVLRLMRFLREVEVTLGYRIPPTAPLHLGTVRKLAAAIRSGVWPEASPLILLRDGRIDCAVFIVSSGDGVILSMCTMALAIDFPGQIWGLQQPGLDGETEPLASVSMLAQHYVEAMLARGVLSTYHIVGHSFSGLIAVEMARILLEKGHDIGLIGLLDTNCYQKYWPFSLWLSFVMKRTGRRILEVQRMSPRTAIGHIASKATAMARLLGRRLGASAAAAYPQRSIYYVGGLHPEFQRVRDGSIIAFETYRPKPIHCKIVLFRPTVAEPGDPVALWRRLATDLEVVIVQGSHLSMLRKPFANSLAWEISRQLARFPIPM